MTHANVAERLKLPTEGAALGIDVGYSVTRRSSAVCRLSWDSAAITWLIKRFRATPNERQTTILEIAGPGLLQAAAFDGPIRRSLDVIGRYRVAERMLTRRLGSRIGKPGQASAPVGKLLNAATNECAEIVIHNCHLAHSSHVGAIHDSALIEAFPTAFLGMLLSNSVALDVKRNNRSDLYFCSAVESGTLQRLLTQLCPDRVVKLDLEKVTNHDDRAALICAITALCVAAGQYTAVGDDDGWIILPPRSFIQDWAWDALQLNADELTPECLRYSKPDPNSNSA